MLGMMRDLLTKLPVDDEHAAIEEAANKIVRQGMGPAAILFLETSKPLGFLAGQTALMATPLLAGFIEPMRLEKYAGLMSNRTFIERLIQRIEEIEAEREGNCNKTAEQNTSTE